MAQIPDEPRCDLVMKGGITSGVVYPKAVLKLKDAGYRFCKIGGTSVGAIAASIVAASQYGELKSKDPGSGFAALEKLNTEITTPRFILSLFQPVKDARDGFDTLLPLVTGKETRFRRLLGVVGMALRRRAWVSVIAIVVFAAYAVLLGFAWGRSPASVVTVAALTLGTGPAAVALITVLVAARLLQRSALVIGGGAVAMLALATLALDALALAGVGGGTIARAGLATSGVMSALYLMTLAALASVGLILYALKTAIEGNFFGMCRGKPGLTEWLYGLIQEGAGVDRVNPLTFADLEEAGVTLQMVTTDLSYSRPMALPPQPDNGYLFDLEEWRCFFPEEVVGELAKIREENISSPRNAKRRLRSLPGPELPIIVAARLSLSYPMLLSALPLYSVVRGDTGLLQETDPLVVEHWFSDGGISSNFPIHFFDSWIPGQPSFGLDLQPYPDKRLAARLPSMESEPVYMPTSCREQSLPHWSSVDGIGGFFRQIFDAARNWRDALQGEIPGSRERICHVRLNRDEGGLNLEMDTDVVNNLLDRGDAAGQKILDNFNWPEHRFMRYLTLMDLLETNLVLSNEPERFPDFAALLREAGFADDPGGHDAAWWTAAVSLTEALLKEAGRWAGASSAATDSATASTGQQPASPTAAWPKPPKGGFGAGKQAQMRPAALKVVPRA